jgi:hypothetical protein
MALLIGKIPWVRFSLGVSIIGASSQTAIVIASHSRARCAFQGAFGGSDRASQSTEKG